MKAIIDEYPSTVPVSVRNNRSGYNALILVPSRNTSWFDWSNLGLRLDGDSDGDGDGEGDSDGEGEGEGEGEGNSNDDGNSDGEGSDDEGGNSNIKDAPAEKQIPSKSLKTSTIRLLQLRNQKPKP